MKKQNKTKKLYVISSTKFSSLTDASRQMLEWWKEGRLDSNARVYEVAKVYNFRVIADLRQEKPKKAHEGKRT